ncbi:MAG: MFS transporter [Thermogutta sp.]
MADNPIYDLTFWLAYLSNALVSAGNTLLCRYADYVNFLGADEFHLGLIIGFGMVGSLLMRFALGHSIDRFGARRIWLLTILATTMGCIVHLGINDYRGFPIYLARVFYIISLAGVFSSSMTLISARAPKQRLAEVVGIYGSAGFAGILLGAPVADILFPAGITSVWESRLLFLTAGGMCLLSLPLAWVVPPERSHRKPDVSRRIRGGIIVSRPSLGEPSLFRLVVRYISVPTVIAGMVAGAALSIPPSFLPRYVAEFGEHSVSGFLFLYAATAIVVRGILLPQVSGRKLDLVILLGTIILCISQLLFLIVRLPWQLVFPGVVFGVAHAFLFPAIVAAGSSTFPKRHRGLATTLMMATFDAGLFAGGPLAGVTLRVAGDLGWPRYPTMFSVISACLVIFAVYYAATMKAGRTRPGSRRRDFHSQQTASLLLKSPARPSVAKRAAVGAATNASHQDSFPSPNDSHKAGSVTVSQKLVQTNGSTGFEITEAATQPSITPKTEPIAASA